MCVSLQGSSDKREHSEDVCESSEIFRQSSLSTGEMCVSLQESSDKA